MSKVKVWLFGFLFFCYIYTHQDRFNSPTPVSRLDLLHSLIVHNRIDIDAYHENTSDKAFRNGHYYSDKAPGTVIVAFPAFALAAWLLNYSGNSLDSEFGWLFSSWMACAGSVAIIAALGGVALFAWLSERVQPRVALITTLGIFLGSAPWPYSTMMYSHAMTIGLIAISLWATDQGVSEPAPSASCDRSPKCNPGRFERISGEFSRIFQSNYWSVLSGFCCGLALASEYTSGIVVAGILFWIFYSNRSRAIPFFIGSILPLMAIPLYSWVSFGDPFTLPYSYQATFPEMSQGLFAIKWPNLETALNLLFNPARGLFIWTPFLAMAGFGFPKLFRTSRKLFWLALLAPVLTIVVISGRVFDWQAGACLGPRYLSPIIPLLALPCAFALEYFPKLGVLLAIWSIEITSLATLTDAAPEPNMENPFLQIHIPSAMNGKFSPNFGIIAGLPPYISVALLYLIIFTMSWWLWRRCALARKKCT